MVRLPALGNDRVQWLGSDADQVYKRFVSSCEKDSCLRRSLRNFRGMQIARYSFRIRFHSAEQLHEFPHKCFFLDAAPLVGRIDPSPLLGIAAICLRVLESDEVRAKRAERNKKKELRSLAERISSYGQGIHQRFVSGDVIVSERDLAEELRKSPDAVITALNLLLDEYRTSNGLRREGIGNRTCEVPPVSCLKKSGRTPTTHQISKKLTPSAPQVSF